MIRKMMYIRFFGFPFDETQVVGWGHNDAEADWEKFCGRKMGIEEPIEVYDDKRFREEGEYRDKWVEYWKQLDDLVVAHGCEIGYHSDSRFPSAFVSISDSQCYIESRGQPKCSEEPVPPLWFSKIEEFCSAVGIPFKEPRWYELIQ